MKKLLAFVALTALTTSAYAVGTVDFNNYTVNPVYIGDNTTGAPDGTMVEIWGGPAGGALALLTLADGVSTSTTTSFGGYFDGGAVAIPSVDPGNVDADLMVRAWTGAADYDSAITKGSVSWTQQVGEFAPPAPPPSVDLAMPDLVMVIPEPSTIVLGLLGAAALLLRRRK